MKHVHFSVVVIGAGPAGLAAIASASQYTDICLIDDNPAPGGQIWRSDIYHPPDRQASKLLAHTTHVTTFYSSSVIGIPDAHTLLVASATETLIIHFTTLILATGARERFLPFPGWTIPGVMGAGGLQALVKKGLQIKGKRVVVAGSGPLLLAVAAYLKSKGALVQAIIEQTTWLKLTRFALHLTYHIGHLRQATTFARQLMGIPLYTRSQVRQAHGNDHLIMVTIEGGREIACDYLACGFGLIPNLELPTALGCTIRNGFVQINEWQQTSLPHIYAIGEITGIGGLEAALSEGQIAGLAATEQQQKARSGFAARQQTRRFTALLEKCYVLRPELKKLPEHTTLLCRCEDISYQELHQYTDWRAAKLHTRCGMGACQGRICGAATDFLFGWTQDSIRPPLVATRIKHLTERST